MKIMRTSLKGTLHLLRYTWMQSPDFQPLRIRHSQWRSRDSLHSAQIARSLLFQAGLHFRHCPKVKGPTGPYGTLKCPRLTRSRVPGDVWGNRLLYCRQNHDNGRAEAELPDALSLKKRVQKPLGMAFPHNSSTVLRILPNFHNFSSQKETRQYSPIKYLCRLHIPPWTDWKGLAVQKANGRIFR